jgi:hypothetical protein
MPQRVLGSCLLFAHLQERHGVFAEVAAVGSVPFVVFFDEDASRSAQDRGGVGEGESPRL